MTGVAAVIVTHNNEQTIDGCLSSIEQQVTETVVVDCGSTDSTVALLRQRPSVQFLESDNVGFAAGVNRGVRESTAERLLILNPDTWTPTGTVAQLLRTAQRLEDGGHQVAMNPCLVDRLPAKVDDRNVLHNLMWTSRVGLRRQLYRPKPLQPFDSHGIFCVPRLSGAALFIRRDLFDAMSGFDEGFFLYYEDTDLSVRLRSEGVCLVLDSGAFVSHERGVSSRGRSDWLRRVQHDSHMRFVRKHRGTAVVIAVRLEAAAARLAYRAVKRRKSSSPARPRPARLSKSSR